MEFNEALQHSGIKGMKWGIRKQQSLSEAMGRRASGTPKMGDGRKVHQAKSRVINTAKTTAHNVKKEARVQRLADRQQASKALSTNVSAKAKAAGKRVGDILKNVGEASINKTKKIMVSNMNRNVQKQMAKGKTEKLAKRIAIKKVKTQINVNTAIRGKAFGPTVALSYRAMDVAALNKAIKEFN